MLDPLTYLEVHDLMRATQLDGIKIANIRAFVSNHAMADAIYAARGEDGDLHGVIFGWPINTAAGYDGRFVNEPEGAIFFVNMAVIPGELDDEIMLALKDQVVAALPKIKFFCYQRAKHGDRMKMYELERISRDG